MPICKSVYRCFVEVLREFRKRFLGKRPVLFKSGQWHFHQDNAPVQNSIFVTHYLTKRGIKTGARGVMVIIAGCGHGNTSSNPGRD